MENEKKSSFEVLAAIDVGAKIEKKNGLSYLSWAWALDTLLRADSEASWIYQEPKMFGETMMVYCTVTAFGKIRTAHLPVMDYRNKPIANPGAFDVNTAMQRALVKAIALHGLGLYIYAGEDLPSKEGETPTEPKKPSAAPTTGLWEALPEKTRNRLMDLEIVVKEHLEQGSVDEAVKAMDASGLDADEKAAIWTRFDSKARSAMKREKQEMAIKAGMQA